MMAIGRSTVSSAHRGPQEYDLNLEVASSGNAATRLGDDFPSDTTIRESGNASRLLNAESGVALGAPSVKLSAVTQSGADVLVSKNIDALPTRGEDNALVGIMPEWGGCEVSPMRRLHWQFLHYLALLGLVAVARRG